VLHLARTHTGVSSTGADLVSLHSSHRLRVQVVIELIENRDDRNLLFVPEATNFVPRNCLFAYGMCGFHRSYSQTFRR
jgi:hypothetical protein